MNIKVHSWRPLRISLVFLILTAYAIATLWLYRECSVVSTSTPDAVATTETTCAPPTVTSASVLVLILLVVLFLWPDLSEITVLGVALKRKVEEAKNDAAAAKEQVGALSQLVQSLQIQITSTAASASISQSFFLPDYPWGKSESERVQQSVRELKKERDENLRSSSAQGPIATDPDRTGAIYLESLQKKSDDELKMILLRDWENLSSLLGIQGYGRGKPDSQLNKNEVRKQLAQKGFIADYRETIAGVRSLRNAVAHGMDVSRQDVTEGLQAVALLTPMARDWLAEHGVE